MLAASILAGTGQKLSHPPPLTPPIGFAPDKVASGLMNLPIYPFALHNVAFSPDGAILATGTGAGTVHLWNLTTGTLGWTVPAHTNWAFSVAWFPDGKRFAIGGGDDLIHTRIEHACSVRQVIWGSADGLPLPVRNERGEGRGEGHPAADRPAHLQARRPSSPRPSPPSEGERENDPAR